jgi:hypothetical protein
VEAATRGSCVSLNTVDISKLKHEYNYALNKSGSTILKASKGVENKASLLDNSDDSYLTIPDCNRGAENYVIIGLADDVQVENIIVSNQEDFSANLGQIKFYGSIDYPPSVPWIEIGTIEPGE